MTGLEDNLFEALKYARVGGMTPAKVLRSMIKNMELTMLRSMRAQLDIQIQKLATPESGPKVDESLNPFTILGVTLESTKEEVIKAYREKARAVHPDAGGSNEEMAKVNAAYQTIKAFKGWT